MNYAIIHDAKAKEKNRLRTFPILIWRYTEFEKPIRFQSRGVKEAIGCTSLDIRK